MTCKKADQKQITKQKGNPDAFGKQGVPGFMQSFELDTAKRILNIYDYVWCFVVF